MLCLKLHEKKGSVLSTLGISNTDPNITTCCLLYLSYYRIGPAVLRQSTYGTIKFGIYYTLKNWVGTPDKEDLATNIFCGVIAGTVSSAIANPTDVLKVRMQACSTTLQQKSMLECFHDVYQQEGLAGLWRVRLYL